MYLHRYNPRTKLSKEAIPDLEMISSKFLDTKVFESKIRQSVAIEDAQANRNSTVKGKKSPISKDYDALFEEILKEILNMSRLCGGDVSCLIAYLIKQSHALNPELSDAVEAIYKLQTTRRKI